MPEAVATQRALCTEQAADLCQIRAERLGGDFQTLTPLDQLRTIAGVMEEAGFMADSSQADGEFRLSVHNCALHAVASCLPEVCDTELKFLTEVLGARVERREHIMNGCNACEYTVDFDVPTPTASNGSPSRKSDI